MIECPAVRKSEIRFHYDLSTVFYRLFWGPHIHHGLWNADESPDVAQRQLIDAMATRAGLVAGEKSSLPGRPSTAPTKVVDVGCGMGGSSVHLAHEYGADVTGITISRVQRLWAGAGARMRGVGARTRFLKADAEQIDFPPGSFDVLWSVECTEHLFDKPAFFRKAARWLKPGGRLAICAWLSGHEPLDEAGRRRVFDVCEGFLCPSLGTRADYESWFVAAGLQPRSFDDWTERVTQTWEICKRRVARTGVRHLSRWLHRGTTLFLDRFDAILDAYRTRSMLYGCFIADVPAAGTGATPEPPRTP
jgi:tocopherol O-methyltransferase